MNCSKIPVVALVKYEPHPRMEDAQRFRISRDAKIVWIVHRDQPEQAPCTDTCRQESYVMTSFLKMLMQGLLLAPKEHRCLSEKANEYISTQTHKW